MSTQFLAPILLEICQGRWKVRLNREYLKRHAKILKLPARPGAVKQEVTQHQHTKKKSPRNRRTEKERD